MRNKGEVYSIFVSFHAFLVTQFSANLRIFQSDGGGEYLNHSFKQYLLAKASSSPSHLSPLIPPSISLHNAVLPACSTSSSTMSPAVSLDTLPSPIISSNRSGLDSTTQLSPPEDPDFHPENLCVVLPLSPMNLHPMTTRSKNGISKKKAYSTTVQSLDFSSAEPSSFKIASKIAA
jgi:hypothetical protein